MEYIILAAFYLCVVTVVAVPIIAFAMWLNGMRLPRGGK